MNLTNPIPTAVVRRPVPSPAAEQQRVDEWNTLHVEGTRVRVRLQDGSWMKTETAREAFLNPLGRAVIRVFAITGDFPLDRVEAL